MDAPLQDERISAFLDGELPPDERAEFERQMADSAELRQLVDELRAVRDRLQTLPRHRLEEDFAARILQRAERAMLTSQPPAAQSPAAPPRQASPVEAARPEPHRSRRPWIWAAVTIAAAVLLMVFNPVPKNAKVARLDNAATKKDSRAKAPQSELAKDADRIAPAGAISAAPGDSGGDGKKSDAESLALPRDGIGAAAGAPSGPAAADKQPQSKESSDAKFAAKQSDGESRPAGGQESGQFAGGRRVPVAGFAAHEAAKKSESLAAQMRMRAADMRPPLHGPPNEQIIVAEFTAARKIAAAGFPALLAKRGITLVQAPSAPSEGKAFGGKPGGAASTGSPSAAPSFGPEAATKAGPAARASLAKSPDRPSRAAEQVEVIYVEASREQVRGLLEDLSSRPATYGFVAVSIVPEPSSVRGPAAAAPPPAVAGKGGVAGGGQGANRPTLQDEKSAVGQSASAEKGRGADAAGLAPATPDVSKLDDGRSRQDSANGMRELAEPTALATQIESVPPAAEELLQEQQRQLGYGRRGPSQSIDKDLQDRARSSPAAAPSKQPPAAANPEPNEQANRGEADKLQYAAPRGGEKDASQRNLANQPANQAGPPAAKSATGRGSLAADSAFSQFNSDSALGDGAPDRVQAVIVFRLGSPAAASPVPAAPAAPANPPR